MYPRLQSQFAFAFGIAALTLGCATEPIISAESQDALVAPDDDLDEAVEAVAPNNSNTPQHRRRSRHQRTPNSCDSNASACPTACTPKTCTAVKPTNPLITDWQDVAASGMFVDNDACTRPGHGWWNSFFGGAYVYPALDPCSDDVAPEYPLTQSTDGQWNVQGTVGTWSGFGLWFGPCTVDLSAYRGISFSIWGDVGQTKQLTFNVLTSQNSKVSDCLTNVGTCDPTVNECQSAAKSINVPETPGLPITLLWSELTGGSPFDGVDPTQVLGIHFAVQRVEWGGVVTAPFPIKVNVGAVTLVP